MNQRPARPLSRGEKCLYVSCALVMFGILGIGLYMNAREATPNITFPPERPSPEVNGYDLYLDAARTIALATYGVTVDPVDDPTFPNLTLAQRNARYSLARRRAWMTGNGKGFALFQQALQTPASYHRSRGKVSSDPDFSTLRQLARIQVKRINTYKMEGRWDEAAQAGLDTIQLGNDVARGSSLLPKLVGTAIIAIGRSPLETDEDLPGRLNAKAARAAATRLETLIAQTPTVAEAMPAQRWESLTNFLAATKKPNWRLPNDASALVITASSEEAITWREMMTARLIFKSEIARKINHVFDTAPATLNQPYSKLSKTPAPDLDLLTRQFVPPVSRIGQNQAREWIGLRLLLLRFALQAYKAEHNAYPTQLNQLTPSYLKRVPTDNYADDKPFHYVLRGQNYKLWSIGPDGIDNGGKPIPDKSKKIPGIPHRPSSVMFDAKGDWVVGVNR